jgi:hypothetical protein
MTIQQTYVKARYPELYDVMVEALPKLNVDQLNEQIKGSRKLIRGMESDNDGYRIHSLAVTMCKEELSNR